MKTNDYILSENYLAGEGKMSLPEKEFSTTGFFLLADTVPAGVHIEVMLYEWVTFNLPGGKYTPDFMVRLSNGVEIFVEVKQESFSKKGKVFRGQSYRDSRSKLRAAASLNPWWRFYMAIYSHGGWRLEYIEPDPFIYPRSMKTEADNGSL